MRVVIFSDMLIYGTELRSASLGVFKSSDKSQLYSLRRTIMLHEGCDVMDSATYLRVGGAAGVAVVLDDASVGERPPEERPGAKK